MIGVRIGLASIHKGLLLFGLVNVTLSGLASAVGQCIVLKLVTKGSNSLMLDQVYWVGQYLLVFDEELHKRSGIIAFKGS